MAKQTLTTIKNWFRTRLKPTQAQYWDTWDSFWHKDETIPVAKVENLTSILAGKATNESVTNLELYEYWQVKAPGMGIVNYGELYNRYAVVDARNITPAGWHIPTDSEVATLLAYLGGDSVAGGKLREAGLDHWDEPNEGATNSSGFTAVGNGYRNSADGQFYNLNKYCLIWTASENAEPGDYGSALELKYYDVATNILPSPYTFGCSVRPVKDETLLNDGEAGTYTGNDGRIYPTICIGTQEFLATNLAETKYRNGEEIAVITDNAEWIAATTGAKCAFDNLVTKSITKTIVTQNVIKHGQLEIAAGLGISVSLVDNVLTISLAD